MLSIDHIYFQKIIINHAEYPMHMHIIFTAPGIYPVSIPLQGMTPVLNSSGEE